VDGDRGLFAAAHERRRRLGAEAAGKTIAARTLPWRAASIAAGSASSRISKLASPLSAAATAREIALPSASTTAIGTRLGLSLPEPNSEPKKAAMTIGAAIDITSARRFEK
jgi:hypothetical protein